MAAKKASGSISEVEQLARVAGLTKALKDFPDDVAVAAQSAESSRKAAGALELVNAEPWPPMQTRNVK